MSNTTYIFRIMLISKKLSYSEQHKNIYIYNNYKKKLNLEKKIQTLQKTLIKKKIPSRKTFFPPNDAAFLWFLVYCK